MAKTNGRSNDSGSDAETNAQSDTSWDAIGSAVTNTGESITLTLPDQGAAGDLTGSYPDPLIAPGAVRTDRIADGAVTSQKIAPIRNKYVFNTI